MDNELPTESENDRSVDRAAQARLLDANFNRASEGLRVAEDVLRLARHDAVLGLRAKQIRHAIGELLGELGGPSLVRARNVAEDVGRTAQTDGEYHRASTSDLLVANLRRVQQSLRVMEECLKSIARPLAERAEALRYEVYQLEFAAESSATGQRELGEARLCALVDGGRDREQFARRIGEIVDAGVDLIQLRDKSMSDRELLGRADLLRQITEGHATRWIVNDRADLAALSGADGVQLGQQDLRVSQARRVIGPDRWIGVSTHSLDEAEQAVFDGANFLGVGPTFVSRTKQFDRLCGPVRVAEIVSQVAIPCFAIGGITLENVGQLLDAGVRRIAVSSAIIDAPSPAAAVRMFQDRLRSVALGPAPMGPSR